MQTHANQFGQYLIAHREDGRMVEVQRSADEIVFLAFDRQIKRLIEIHVLKEGQGMTATEKRSAMERAQTAMQLRGPAFMRLLEVGSEGEMVYYTTSLNDGEFVEDYVARRGSLPPATVFCLMSQFLDELVTASSMHRLLGKVQLHNALLTTQEDVFLQLRLVDYGLSDGEGVDSGTGLRFLVTECCRLMFLLLTGQVFEGQNPDRYPVLTALPTSLRASLRASLISPEEGSSSLEKLRDDVRDAYAAMVSSLQARSSRKHIVITDSNQPQSQLQGLLLESMPVAELLKGRFDVVHGEDVRHYPFSLPAVNTRSQVPVTVHLLPPARIVDRKHYEAVPLQMWRFDPAQHPNILRSLSVWENPNWTFLTEEREPGFTLSRLMAERVTLNPAEVAVILKQARAGLSQAAECGVTRVNLHPSGIVIRVGKGGAIQARETEKLMLKRVDAWPPFQLKLRTHLTMRSLYEAPLVDAPLKGETSSDRDKDFAFQSMLGLALYLLTGERQVRGEPQFDETVSESLAAYLRKCISPAAKQPQVQSADDFISSFESFAQPVETEGRGIAAIKAASASASSEPMESAGAISDFDEDDGPSYLQRPADGGPLGVKSLPEHKPSERGTLGMIAWAALSFCLTAAAVIFFFGGQDSSANSAATATATTTPAKPTPVAPAVKPAKAPPVKVELPKPEAPEEKLVAPQIVEPQPPVVAPSPSVPAKPQEVIRKALPPDAPLPTNPRN
jgi:hypothetical protein